MRGWKETQEILYIFQQVSTYFVALEESHGQGNVACCFVLMPGKNILCLLNMAVGKFNFSVSFDLEPSVLLKCI